jgi:penicillin-binding protein 1A
VIETAYKMGITQTTLQPFLTLTLGTIESTATEMATVGSTIANGGTMHPPIFVSRIVAPGGKVLFNAERDVAPVRAISASTAACELDLLRGVITSGTGTAARLNGHDSAGKTGTTDNKADANFLQITPSLVAFTWHGNAAGRIPGAGFGGQIPARISKLYMDAALAFTPNEPFPAPPWSCAKEGEYISEVGRTPEPPFGFPEPPPPPEEQPPEVVAPPPAPDQGNANRKPGKNKP